MSDATEITPAGTDLYRRTLAFDYGDRERADLMAKVWAPTPYMLDAFTGSCDDRRHREIIDWCFDQFGDQCSPIHGRAGRWQRGSATVNGWTWFGFASADEMDRFAARWPVPAEAIEADAITRRGAIAGLAAIVAAAVAPIADPLRALVFANLEAALGNDHDFSGWSDDDVARDLVAFAADLEDREPAELLPHVAAWRAVQS